MQLGKRSNSPLPSGRVNSHAVLSNLRIHYAQLMFTIFGILNPEWHLTTGSCTDTFQQKARIWGRKSHSFSRQCYVSSRIYSFRRSTSFSYQRIQLWGYNHWMLAPSKISSSSTERGGLSMCPQGSRRMHLRYKLSRVWMYLWLFNGYKKRGKK